MKLIKPLVILSIIILVLQIVQAISFPVYATESVVTNKQGIAVKNPSTDLWRAIRQRQQTNQGDINTFTQVKGINAGRLINAEGNEWRLLRRQKIIPYTAYFILGVIVFLALLLVFIRRAKIPNGRSEKKIRRFSTMQRVVHWFLVILVGFMGLTGFILLFGRFGIIPLIGAEAFSPLASVSKEGHNLSGPIMIISILLMLVYYIRHNFPGKGDLKWLVTAGGLLSKKHLKNGFFNAGEKLLFWGVISLGIILSVTGLVLLFPYYGQTINMTQLALVVHAIAAICLIALSLAHIFMTIKVEGTLDAITSGEVDENWAKAHHALWYEKHTGQLVSKVESSTEDNSEHSNATHDGTKGAIG